MNFLQKFLDFFKKKDSDMSEEAKNGVATPKKHKLEIQVYEADWEKADSNNGKPNWRPVRSDPVLDGGRPNIIEVVDKKELVELQKQYALCDQQIKVIREIDPFPWDGQPQKTGDIPAKNQAIPVQDNINAPQPQQTAVVQHVVQQPQQTVTQMQAPKLKPKIVTIGDVEIKYDGDKVYQKQWMKLTPSEANNFRIVNDSNNKIMNLNGKHIEAKRWICVEVNSEDNVDDAVESILQN